MANYNFTSLKARGGEVLAWLAKELHGVRTGRATPMILDHVMVKAYDARTPLKQLASISIEDAKSLRVVPWDRSQTKEIETAIAAANLGISVAPDASGLRIIFPSLTAESRLHLEKLVRGKLEEAKITWRLERDRAWTEIQTRERTGDLSQDDKFRAKDELQKIVDATNQELEQAVLRKEKEIRD